MRLSDFKALTFDCYGTLIDWERGLLAELRPWAARHRLDVSDDALLAAFGEIETRCEAETPAKLYPDILAEVLRRLAKDWSVQLSSGEAEAFGASVGRWPAFPDSADALKYLKQHYKLVILSNVDRASFAKSNEKLGVVFDRVVTAQDVGSYKPSLRNFEHVLGEVDRYLGIRRGEVLHTAQSLFHDVVPAKSLGLATAWVNRRKAVGGGWGATPPAEAKPDFEVASLGELAELHRRELRGA